MMSTLSKKRVSGENEEEHPEKRIRLDEAESTSSVSADKVESYQNRFEKLPDEVIMKVLSFLDKRDLASRASSVCTRFRRVGKDTSLWTRLEFHEGQNVSPRSAVHLWRRHPQLEILRFLGSETGNLACLALKKCSMLKRLDLVSTSFNEQDMKELFKAVEKHDSLNYLTIRGIWNGKAIESNAKCLRKLTGLSIDGKGFSDETLIAIADHCSFLQEFRTTEEASDESLALNYFLEKVKGTLKHLELGRLKILNKATLDDLGQCQQLESLHLWDAGQLTSSGMQAISKLSKLKHLTLEKAWRLEDCDFKSVFSNGKLRELITLSIIDYARMSSESLTEIADNCPDLTSLTLQRCPLIDDEDVQYLLLKCRKLTKLDLRFCCAITSGVLSYDIPSQMRELILPAHVKEGDKGCMQKFKISNPAVQICLTCELCVPSS